MSNWNYAVDNSYTFFGVYHAFYDKVARRWKAESTRAQNDSMYNSRIIPNLANHDEKAIGDYTREDYDDAIERIIAQGQDTASGRYVKYAEATVKTFRRLIYYVVEVAAEEGLCENVLWESNYNPRVSVDNDERTARNALLPKSLTVAQEKAVMEKLNFFPPHASGQEMGLLLMYALGLRNSEACGLNYEDIKPMQNHRKCKVAWIYKKTDYETNEVRGEMKTPNADRVVPVPDGVAEAIAFRRQYMETLTGKSVGAYPIACVDSQWDMRCASRQLTNAARKLFQEIKMDAAQLASIDDELRSAEEHSSVREKDPTAYIFRRNFGMHLHILGLTEAEIQYVIGHDIEDPYETRNEFMDEVRLYRIYRKMLQRPQVNFQGLKPNRLSVPPEGLTLNTGEELLKIPADGSKVKLHLQANEPLDEIEVKITAESQDVKISSAADLYSCSQDNYSRTVDVRRQYHCRYGE